MNSSPLEKLKFLSENEIKTFADLFPEISTVVMSSAEFKELPIILQTYYEKLWVSSIPQGRKIRAEVLILAFKFFSSDMSMETVRLSYILGWVQEIVSDWTWKMLIVDLHSASMIGDGLRGKIQKGASSWYLQDIASVAVLNDMSFIENAAYILTKIYFGNKPYHMDLINFLHVTSFSSSFGRSLDLMSEKLRELSTSPNDCMSLYEKVTQYRSTNSIFYASTTLAMIMAGVKIEKSFLAVKDITLRIGAYYQAQHDFMEGRDPKNGNYTWQAVAAFENANDVQRKILLDNYGRQDFFHVHEVKTIFEHLNIAKLYWKYEYESQRNINLEIEKSVEYPQLLFQLIMAAIAGSSS